MRRVTTLLVFLLTALLLTLPSLAQDVISTTIGGGPSDMPALDANLNNPVAVAVDSTGNYYIAASSQNRVFKVDTTGLLTVLAGNGLAGYSGDTVAGGAASAMLNSPQGLAVDSSGNVYIADTNNFVVRKVDTTNTITTIAGTQATCGGSTATLCYPNGVAADTAGNLFIADTNDCQVKKLVLSSSIMSVFAGNGTCAYSGDNGGPTSAEVSYPSGVAVDGSGNVFIADTNNFVIREVVKATNKIKTVAGNNALGAGYAGDGGAAISAQIYYVYKLSVNSTGTTVTIADGLYNSRIRQFTVGGNINTVAGGGPGNTGCVGFSGDTGPANQACFYYPQGVAVSSTGTVYVADTSDQRIRSFTVGGNINTVAGNGSTTQATVVNGVAANGVELYNPWAVYEDPTGNIFVADSYDQMVRELSQSSGLVNAFAGTGTAGFSGDGSAATAAQMYYPSGVARDSSGNIYIADTNNCVIRMVNSAGNISTIAGIDTNAPSPSCAYSGDGGPATSAQLYYPDTVYVDSKNNVFIPDTYNHVVREVTAGTINTIAGIPGQAGFSGDGGPATSARLYYPGAVAEDGAGNIYIADTDNHRIREITAATGTINTIAGNGACAFSGDGIAIENSLCYPAGLWADANGNIFIADQYNQRVRWVSAAGIMTTFAGNGSAGFNGDGGLAINADLYYPTGIWEDSLGNFLIADQYNDRIRGVTAFSALNASANSLNFPLVSVGSTSPAQQVILSALGAVTIANISVTGDFTESDDCPSALPNTGSCTVYVYFAPKSGGIRTGTLTINNNGFFNSVTTVALSGTGTAISLTGAPINFGNQLKNTTSAVKNVTVKNNGSTTITITSITLNETTDFAISSNTCGASLAAKASCVIGLTFTPTTTGPKKGAVIITDNDPTSPQIIGLSGTGTSNVSLAPNVISFAATPVGTASASTKITLTNKTGVSITLNTPAITVTGPFVNAAGTTCTNGLTIVNLGTCTINVQFKPTVVGYASGTLSVNDNDVTSPQTVSLSGIGTALRFTPPSINFGTVTRGQQVNSTVSLTNAGTTTVTIAGYDMVGANSADFTFSSPCGASIAPGTSCTLTMYFTPSKTGLEKATFKVYDNSFGSPQSLALSGTGQ